jgi:hypothetical protein
VKAICISPDSSSASTAQLTAIFTFGDKKSPSAATSPATFFAFVRPRVLTAR